MMEGRGKAASSVTLVISHLPEPRKQKPSHRLGSLNSGARTRNRTKDTGIFNPFKKDQMLYQH